ncbi:hypothetical protein A2U01_0064392, partial [Trifolium medium]|nr:hypothetical protein [Trifolium medium]
WNSPSWAQQPAQTRKNRAAFCARLGPSRAGRNRQQPPRKTGHSLRLAWSIQSWAQTPESLEKLKNAILKGTRLDNTK